MVFGVVAVGRLQWLNRSVMRQECLEFEYKYFCLQVYPVFSHVLSGPSAVPAVMFSYSGR